MTASLGERLARLPADPWPAEPSGPADETPHGWFCPENERLLRELLGPQTRLIVELGSWQGLSALRMVQMAPLAQIICIDHWQGSAEHRIDPVCRVMLPGLYDRFRANLWNYRERVHCLRTTTDVGIWLVHQAELGPLVDLAYIDAAHDYASVLADVRACAQAFPFAELVGDDWDHAEVRRAVTDYRPAGVWSDGNCWWMPQPGPRPMA